MLCACCMLFRDMCFILNNCFIWFYYLWPVLYLEHLQNFNILHVILLDAMIWYGSMAPFLACLKKKIKQYLTLDVQGPDDPCKLGQYHGYWCPGTWHCHFINSHDIDCLGIYCLFWEWISTPLMFQCHGMILTVTTYWWLSARLQ